MASLASLLLRTLVRFGPLHLLKQRLRRFTRDVVVRHKPENGKQQGGQDIMTTIVWIPEVTLPTDPEGAAIRRGHAEPIEDPVLADAEEEEIAALWTGDTGNQGA